MAADFIPDSEFKPDTVLPTAAPATQPTASAEGDFIPDSDFVSDADKYSTPTEQLKTAAEGVGKGLAGPLFTGAETALLGNEKEQMARAEANPLLHGTAEVAGFVGPALASAGASTAARLGVTGAAKAASAVSAASHFTQAGLLEKAGIKAAQALNLGGKEASILSKIGAKSVSEATQMALLQGGDEVSKMIQHDPNQTSDTVIADLGLATVLGGGVGAAFGAVAPLWKAAVGDKAAQLVEDFKGRMKFHAENPEPTQAVVDELTQLHAGMRATGDEVFGPTGLKSQDIAKAMPEMHAGIPEQAQKLVNDLEERIIKMEAKPNSFPERLVSKAKDDFSAFRETIQNPQATPGEIFNATQDLKQTFQGYAKFDKFVKPVDEAYDFVRQAKDMSHSLREALEDSNVWGKAADRQKSINKAFTEYLPTLKDFEKKFTVEIGGEKVIDPGKVQTYMNQLGKPNAEIKQTMLENFLRESEAYKRVIGDTHANLGIENPIPTGSLAVTHSTLDKVTPGAKLADYFAKKGIFHLAGEAMGTSVGAGVGHLLGHAGIGALVGEKALAPFFSSVLPALVQPFQKVAANSAGVKAAIDYGLAAARGETVINKAAKGVFREATDNVIQMVPRESDRTRLDKALRAAEVDPMNLTKVAGDVGHFLPEHATALANTSANAVRYLNSLRPDTTPKRPLDPKMPPNTQKQAHYNRALDLANQPLLVLASIKRGTLTSHDIKTVQTLYPNLYNKLSQKLTNEMIDQVSKGKPIPYQQKLQLSKFLGQPLDSTMTPTAILAAQPKPPAQQPQTATQPAAGPKRSTTALSKLAPMAQTPSQARQAHKLAHES